MSNYSLRKCQVSDSSGGMLLLIKRCFCIFWTKMSPNPNSFLWSWVKIRKWIVLSTACLELLLPFVTVEVYLPKTLHKQHDGVLQQEKRKYQQGPLKSIPQFSKLCCSVRSHFILCRKKCRNVQKNSPLSHEGGSIPLEITPDFYKLEQTAFIAWCTQNNKLIVFIIIPCAEL